MRNLTERLALVAAMILTAVDLSARWAWGQDQVLLRTAAEIAQEATRSNHSDAGRPLPLAAHWNSSGADNEGFTPQYQLQLIRQGRHLLPWLGWPPTDRSIDENFKPNDPGRQKYIDGQIKAYEPVVKELARLRLPLSFLATQWESELSYDKAFLDLPADKNPNVVGLDGKVQPRVCPFGPVGPWREAGRRWTDNLFMKRIQQWYPDPPLVLLISNNEHGKLTWSEVEQSPRYLAKYGRGRTDDFKRKVVGDGWIERYGALLEGMRAGLVSQPWKKNVRFVGYEAFAPVHFGRWSGWKEYSLITAGRLDPFPFCWDGGSPSYYLHNWMALTDYTLWSPQVESMNWVFALKDVYRVRPEFWFELSTWDGDQPGQSNDKRMFYARQGQPFTPERYEGFVQFGLWLTGARSVREFRGWLETVEYAGPYFDSIVRAVDRIYDNQVLQKFWRKGSLVANHGRKHPYQFDIPPEYKDVDRWFLLDTSLTPRELRSEEFDNARPPASQTEIPVFALVMVLGSPPNREWLVLANAPRRARPGVEITVPEYGEITVDVPQSGSFYHVREQGRQVRTVVRGGPASFRLEAPRFLDVGAEGSFAVAEKYSPAGTLGPAQWEFGDGGRATGDRVTHRYAKAGQYLPIAAGAEGGSERVRRQVPVFVGLKPEENLVCRLLMKGALAKGMKSWLWLGGWEKIEYHFIPDASGAGNIGFLAGGTWVDDPQRGAVLELDGKHDRVEIAAAPDINSAAAQRNRTVAVWFRATSADKPAATPPKDKPKSQPQVLYQEGGPASGINLYLDGGLLYAGVWNAGKGIWLPSPSVEPRGWHHAAVVLRVAKADVAELAVESYLDGRKSGEGKAPLPAANAATINLGRCGNTLLHGGRTVEQPGHYFAGRMADFRIVNRALTAEEIRALAKGE
ncbi:MAG: LamG-like jellyroll fold domain-containing protein [Thermoguttaceae bacterium]|jgi:hypothetical protein